MVFLVVNMIDLYISFSGLQRRTNNNDRETGKPLADGKGQTDEGNYVHTYIRLDVCLVHWTAWTKSHEPIGTGTVCVKGRRVK